MIHDENILLISYPSGGFGNFLFHTLTEFAVETYKTGQNDFKFSSIGDSHNTNKYTNIYFRDPITYTTNIYPNSVNLILCDNGIDNDHYDKIKKVFPFARILRCIINEAIRPIIYQTCVIKAAKINPEIDTKKHVIDNWPDYAEDYAKRENYTLLYHNWPFSWQADKNVINFDLEILINEPYKAIVDLINKLGFTLQNQDHLKNICNQWLETNSIYFDVYYEWQRIDRALKTNETYNLNHIQDLHTQGYINYQIEKIYGMTIPVYDYRNWFDDTDDILKMVKLYEKELASNQ